MNGIPRNIYVSGSNQSVSADVRESSLDSQLCASQTVRGDENMWESSHGDSPTSSQSPLGDGESVNEFYGSGSIEAEEFVDDTEDDAIPGDDGVNTNNLQSSCESNGETTASKNVKYKISQNAHTLIGSAPGGSLRFHNLTVNGYGPTESQRRPCHQHVVGDETLFHISNDVDKRLHGPKTALPRFAPFMQQTNTSHCDPESVVIPLDNHATHTAPVSGQTSPPIPQPQLHIDLAAFAVPHLSNTSFFPVVHQTGFGTHASIHYTHHQHQPHAFVPPPVITCPYHMHSEEVSENNPNHLLNGSECGLTTTAVGTTLTSGNLPVLQPASRFRKARIHETVEQWSCGRALVHDCRLKAIPESVWGIHKNSLALEITLNAAMAKKVNCHSCFTLKPIDVNAFEGIHSDQRDNASISTHSVGANESGSYNLIKPEVAADRSLLLDLNTQTGNLLTHWEGGYRVSYHVPNSDRESTTSHCQDISTTFEPFCRRGTFCANCSDSYFAKDSRLSQYLPHTKLNEYCYDHPSCIVHDETGSISVPLARSTRSVDGQSHISVPFLLESGWLPSFDAVPTNATDPATAYLRRQQIENSSANCQLTVQLEGVDNPVVGDKASMTVSDVMPSISESQQAASQKTRLCSQPEGEVPPNETFDPGKTASKTPVPGAVPPTSPNFIDSAVLDPSRIDASLPPSSMCPSFMTTHQSPFLNPGTSCELNASLHPTEPWLRVRGTPPTELLLSRTRLGSGNYHNVTEVDQQSSSFFGCPGAVAPLRSFINRLSSPPSPSVSFQSALTDSHATGDSLRTSVSVRPIPNPPHFGYYRSPPTYSQSSRMEETRISVSNSSPQNSRLSSAMNLAKLTLDAGRETRCHANSSSLLLDARISESMTMLHSALECAFRDQLAAAHAENLTLLTEIQRLSSEVSMLRGYQEAFHTLRRFVPPEVWDQLCPEQTVTSDHDPFHNMPTSAPPIISSSHLMGDTSGGIGVQLDHSNSPHRMD